jgi:nucleotide-binding universal stress UspA family protein
MTSIVISYDGTENDTDALALGAMLARAGASLSLAYVRHLADPDPNREVQAQRDAAALLAAGARQLGDVELPQHVVLSGSTPLGLRDLAEREHADVIVFGSEYRTSPGHIQPGTSAQVLLDGGPIAVALAPSGMKDVADPAISSIAVVGEEGDPSPRETAESLALALGAELAARADDGAGLVVIGSKPGAAAGRVALSAAAQYLIEMLPCPVLALPHGTALRF